MDHINLTNTALVSLPAPEAALQLPSIIARNAKTKAEAGATEFHLHSKLTLSARPPFTDRRGNVAGDDEGEASASNSARLPADYTRNLRARMQLIGGASKRGPRSDPLSSWPVALPSESVAVNERLTRGQGKVVLQQSARPPLALEIEGYIRKEVQSLTRLVPKPSMLQLLPIYREAFSCFVTHFREYGPTLSLIQKHYDSALDCLTILQQKVDKTQTELHSLRETFHVMLEQEQETLQNQLKDIKLQLEASRKSEAHKLKLLNECDRDLQRLRSQKLEKDAELEDMTDRYKLLASTVREQSAKSARIVARCEKLESENERLLHHVSTLEGRLMGSYNFESAERANGARDLHGGDRYGRAQSPVGGTKSGGHRDSGLLINPDEADLDNPDDLRELLYEEEAKSKKLARLNQLLLHENKVLTKRLAKLQQSKDDETLTPRPQWIAASEALPDFAPNQLQSSEEILDELIFYFKDRLREDRRQTEMKAYSSTVRLWLGEEDLCEGDLVGKGKHFVAKGTGPHVPVYLRYKGLLKNQHMKKGDVENLLSRFWKDRRQYLRMEGQLSAKRIDEFFNEWLHKECPSHKHAMDLAYNVLAVCEFNQYDPDCSMLLRILRGEISEWAMYDQLDMVDKLHEVIANHDKQKRGAVTRITVQKLLNRFFPAKAMDDMLRLRFALIRFCQGTNVVDYAALFREDSDGNQTKFVELVRQQHLQEIAQFVVEIEEALRELIFNGTLTIGSARTAIKVVDPAMPPEKIDEILAFGARMTVDDLLSHGDLHSVPAEPLLERLRTGVLLRRYSRREEDEDRGSDSSSSRGESDAEGEDSAYDRRRRKTESGVERMQRQEEIAELLGDLVIDDAAAESDSVKRSQSITPAASLKLGTEGGASPDADSSFAASAASAGRRQLSSSAVFSKSVEGGDVKEAARQRRQAAKQRKMTAAESALVEQESKLTEARRKEEEELQALHKMGNKYGVKNVSKTSMKLATDSSRSLGERSGSGKRMG